MGAHDIRGGDLPHFPADEPHLHAIPLVGRAQLRELIGQLFVPRPMRLARPVYRGYGIGIAAAQFDLALLEAQGFNFPVHVSNRVFFNFPDLRVQGVRLLQLTLQRIPGVRHSGLPFVQRVDKPVKIAPLAPLENHRVFGMLRVLNIRFVDPPKIAAVHVAVAHLELNAKASGPGSARRGNLLLVPPLPHGLLPVFERHGLDIRRPEKPGAIVQNQRDQPRDHQQTNRQRAPGQPNKRHARFPNR